MTIFNFRYYNLNNPKIGEGSIEIEADTVLDALKKGAKQIFNREYVNSVSGNRVERSIGFQDGNGNVGGSITYSQKDFVGIDSWDNFTV